MIFRRVNQTDPGRPARPDVADKVIAGGRSRRNSMSQPQPAHLPESKGGAPLERVTRWLRRCAGTYDCWGASRTVAESTDYDPAR